VSDEKIIRVSWALLGEWWCAPASATEDDVLAVVLRDGMAPSTRPEVVRGRLYGGFHCANETGRRHIYHATGEYTYTHVPQGEKDRQDTWKDLIEENGEPGNGPFTAAGRRVA